MPDLFVFDGAYLKLRLPSNGINLLEGQSTIIDRDCCLEILLGWISVVDPKTDKPIEPGKDGFFTAPIKVVGGHKEGLFTVKYRS